MGLLEYQIDYPSLCDVVHDGVLCTFTLLNKKRTFLMYKEIQKGSGTKSYMRKGFLIHLRGNVQIFSHI
jgi:hypothetical protein